MITNNEMSNGRKNQKMGLSVIDATPYHVDSWEIELDFFGPVECECGAIAITGGTCRKCGHKHPPQQPQQDLFWPLPSSLDVVDAAKLPLGIGAGQISEMPVLAWMDSPEWVSDADGLIVDAYAALGLLPPAFLANARCNWTDAQRKLLIRSCRALRKRLATRLKNLQPKEQQHATNTDCIVR